MRNQAILAEANQLRTELETGQYDVDEIIVTMVDFYGATDQQAPQLSNSLRVCLDRFPSDCCDIGSVLLKGRLGMGEVTKGVYYQGPRVFKSHAFLTLGDVICDITADQFKRGPRLYVGEFVLPWALKPYIWDSWDPVTKKMLY